MQELLVLKSLDEIKIFAEPLRVQILESLMGDPLTVRQVAERLEEKPTKLYHHFEVMEAAGLIKKVRSQKKRGTVESYYQAAAQNITMDPNLFTGEKPSDESLETLIAALTSLFQSTLAALRSSLREGLIIPGDPQRTGMLAGFEIEATPEQLQEIHHKLKELMKAADKVERKGGPLHYKLTVAFFPTKPGQTKPTRPTNRSRR